VSRLEVKANGIDLALMGLFARLDAARCGQTFGGETLLTLLVLRPTLTSAFRSGLCTHGWRKEPVEGPHVPNSGPGRFR